MEAIRKIVTVKDNMLSIQLPDRYNDTKVELIILPAEENPMQVAEVQVDYYSKYHGAIGKNNLSDSELDSKLKSLRDEWNRDL